MSTIALELVPPFLAVAELGSFSAAATRLRMEKSSVSRAVGRLEDVVGERLFLRTTRSVSLTNAGQMMHDRLREPYDGLDAAMRSILDAARSPRGKITVTSPADFSALLLSEAITRVLRHHPNIDFELRASATYLDLVAENIDVAVRLASKRLKDSTLKARKLAELTVGLFASRSYAERGLPRTMEELKQHPWIVIRGIRDFEMNGPEGSERIVFEGRIASNEMYFVKEMTLRGNGVGMLPWFVAEQDVREGRLVQVLPRHTMQDVAVWWITPSNVRPTRALEVLREQLVDVMSAQPTAFRMA